MLLIEKYKAELYEFLPFVNSALGVNFNNFKFITDPVAGILEGIAVYQADDPLYGIEEHIVLNPYKFEDPKDIWLQTTRSFGIHDFDFFRFVVAHELAHHRQVKDGQLSYGSPNFIWEGKPYYPYTNDYDSHSKLPWEAHANATAASVLQEFRMKEKLFA